jgi:short-subunit dehydrogenase
MCSPFASIYGSTKAFLTEFAMSLAPEVKYNGIDVVVVHPSPALTFSKVLSPVTL